MRHLVLSAAAAATVGYCASGTFAQGLVKNDIAFGLSIPFTSTNNNGVSVEAVRGQPTGTNVGVSWAPPEAQSFVQSTQFDNFDGIRHNALGNLIGLDFGGLATGGRLVNFDTRLSANPGVATQFFDYASYNAANPAAQLTISRMGGLSMSPNNQRLAFIGSDTAGVYVFDYTPGNSQGVGAAVANGRENLGQFRTLSTQGTVWLNNDTLLVADTNGFLKTVDASTSRGGLAVTTVGNWALPYTATSTNPFTAVAYEPTISPFVYMVVNQFSGAGGTPPNTSFNRMYIFDPNSSFAQVGSVDFNTSSQSARELAFDSHGNLFVSQFGLSPLTGAIDVFPNAFNVGSLTTDGSIDYYASAGTSNFNGIDVAMSHPDYVTPNTAVNLRGNATVVEYFAATPLAAVAAKVAGGFANGSWNGVGINSSVASVTPGTGIGFREAVIGESLEDSFAGGNVTVARSSIYLAYTLLGDANLDFTTDIGDFATLASNFNESGLWPDGDFDYNGLVDIGDFAQLAANFNETVAANRSAVPEPALLSAGAALALLIRRRR